MCAASDTFQLTPTGYRTTACETLDEQSFEFLPCATPLVASLRARSANPGYLRSGFRIGSLVAILSLFGVGTSIGQVIFCACGHLLMTAGA